MSISPKILISIFSSLFMSFWFAIFSYAQGNKNIQASVYICPQAASLQEVNPRCPDIVILDLGETVNGMTLTTTNYNGQEYYMVLGFKNGGGGEAYRTQIIYEGDLSGQYSDEIKLKALLTTKEGQPLPGETVNFSLGNQTATAIIDENGVAAATLELLQIPGDYTLEVKFTGEDKYLPSFDSKPFEILKENTVINVFNKESFSFDDIILEGDVKDEEGQVLLQGPNEVEFRLGDTIIGTTTISETGKAKISWKIGLIPKELTETYPIVISFAGNEYYNPAEGQGIFTLKSAKWLKQDAISELEAAKTGNKKTDKEIDQIIKHIQNSLDENLWLDVSHLAFFKPDCSNSEISKLDPDEVDLDNAFELEPEEMEIKMQNVLKGKCCKPKIGLTVFHKEYKAVKLITKQLEGKPKIPKELKATLKKIINKLTKADFVLAKISLNDAKNTPVKDPKFQKIIERQIAKAENKLTSASREVEKGMPNRVILRLAKSWLHSQLVSKLSNF